MLRPAVLCLALLALVACDNRPVAEEDPIPGNDGADAAAALQRPLERAREVDDLNRGRVDQLDEAVDDDAR